MSYQHLGWLTGEVRSFAEDCGSVIYPGPLVLVYFWSFRRSI